MSRMVIFRWSNERLINGYETLVEIYVSDLNFQLDWALRSFQLPISNHDLEVGCRALVYNRLRGVY